MSEARHTPGPWQVDGRNILGPDHIDDDGDEVALCIGIIQFSGDPEGQANARLIAAAPDLLEAAKFALPALEDEASMRKPDDPIRVAAYVLRSAITKAESPLPSRSEEG